MAAAPERSPRYRSTDRWDGANYAVFNPSRVADHITDSLGGQALLVGPEPWPAVRNRSSSAGFDAASVATDRSSGCTQLSAASKLSLRAVLRFIAVLADAVLLVIRPPVGALGWICFTCCVCPFCRIYPVSQQRWPSLHIISALLGESYSLVGWIPYAPRGTLRNSRSPLVSGVPPGSGHGCAPGTLGLQRFVQAYSATPAECTCQGGN